VDLVSFKAPIAIFTFLGLDAPDQTLTLVLDAGARA
jgi:hypothetical protein